MTAAARWLRSLRHRLGDALIEAGARLTADAGPTFSPEQEERVERVMMLALAIERAEREAMMRLMAAVGRGDDA